MKDLLDKISPDDALKILRRLCAADPKLRRRVFSEAKGVLSSINIDDLAQEVYQELNSIDVQDLWDRSGPKRDGYSDPADMAWEMVEETLQPYFDKVKKYAEMKMAGPTQQYCMGVLKGIYDFDRNAKSEFKDWAVDDPAEYFGWLLEEWRKNRSSGEIEKMNRFISEQCPKWADWAIKRK